MLAVMQGATIDFPNQDDIFHNVFSLSSAAGSERLRPRTLSQRHVALVDVSRNREPFRCSATFIPT